MFKEEREEQHEWVQRDEEVLAGRKKKGERDRGVLREMWWLPGPSLWSPRWPGSASLLPREKSRKLSIGSP